MARSLEIPRYPTDALRPDLPIPLLPMSRAAAIFWADVIGLHGPRFGDAQRTTQRVLVLVLVVFSAQLVAVDWVRPWVTGAAALLAGYLGVRIVALSWLEQRQRAFEHDWLMRQSESLSHGWFSVVRLTIVTDPGASAERADRVVLDLTRPDDIQEFLRRRLDAQNSGRSSTATIEFAYSQGPAENEALEAVQQDLTEIDLIGRTDRVRHVNVRFPHARYYAQPDGAHHGRPGQSTFWALGRVVLSVVGPTAGVLAAPSSIVDRSA